MTKLLPLNLLKNIEKLNSLADTVFLCGTTPIHVVWIKGVALLCRIQNIN